MSYHGFGNDNNRTVKLTCCIKLVSYYQSKGFVILENNADALRYIPKRVKQEINAEYLHPNDYVMVCNREILSAPNKLKKDPT